MNTPSPLIPQGSFPEVYKGKSHVRILVFTVLGIHVVLLGALLFLGCKRTGPDTMAESETNDLAALPSWAPESNAFPAVDTNPAPAPTDYRPETNLTDVQPTEPPARHETVTPEPPPSERVPTGTVTEYTIVKGDSFYSIAKKHGITIADIKAANPGVDPLRIRPGQTLVLPPPAPPQPKSQATAEKSSTGSDQNVYAVKSGDTLSRIAARHNTTVNELRNLNHLTTDRIVVGQKLILPPKTAPAAGTTGNP